MIVFEGFHHDKKIPILITVEYDEELDLMIVEVTRGYEKDFKTYTPNHTPTDGLMHISDVEKAVKLANKMIKDLKREATRK
jgi:hypothetical protein